MAVQEPTNIRLAFDADSPAERAAEDARLRGLFESAPPPGAPALDQAEAALLKETEARVRAEARAAQAALERAATEAKARVAAEERASADSVAQAQTESLMRA